MSNIILASEIPERLPIPSPKESITIREAVSGDVANIEALRRFYNKSLAFLPYGAIDGKIKRNEVLIAESSGQFAGYLIGQDKYFKRDDVGIIFHLAIKPEMQRGFVGAALLKAQFERSAYGCKLYCCWCAQDLAANHFYESMGFVPLAFRTGGEAKERTHIFWEKRIREADTTTPWWFPSETKGGMMQADRLVFPIPPGKHWSEKMPVVLPADTYEREKIEGRELTVEKKKKTKEIEKSKPVIQQSISFGRMGARPAAVVVEQVKKEKPVRVKKPKIKNNPEYVAKARELKDRWLEVVNENPNILLSSGKYDLTRQISQSPHPSLSQRERGNAKMLEAA